MNKTKCTECKGGIIIGVENDGEQCQEPCPSCKGTGHQEQTAETETETDFVVERMIKKLKNLKQEQTMKERFEELTMHNGEYKFKCKSDLLDFINKEIALAVQQRDKEIIKHIKDLITIGNAKHSIFDEFADEIINLINKEL